jgi:hypothetical protein
MEGCCANRGVMERRSENMEMRYIMEQKYDNLMGNVYRALNCALSTG